MEQIILPGVLQSLEEVTAFVTQQANAANLDEVATQRVQLAVDELVTNIILHGYEEEGLSGNVVVQAELSPEELVIVTEDSGVAFDPHTHPEPTSLNQSLGDRPIGGLGIHLIRKIVRRHEYVYREGKNCNRLVFGRSRA